MAILIKINTLSLLENPQLPLINQISTPTHNANAYMDITTVHKAQIMFTPALIDTGASVSCINQLTADTLQLNTTPFSIQLADSSTKQIKLASTPIHIKIARILYNIIIW